MIRAKKSLGQNFLVDLRVARRIIDSVSPLATDIIIEIGPGTGALTRLLAERSGYVVAVEIDPRLVEELSRSIAAPNLSIIEADALKVDWSSLIVEAITRWKNFSGSENDPRVRVVANLPYYISTPIIERLIELRGRIFDLTLMLQKEVVDRIAVESASDLVVHPTGSHRVERHRDDFEDLVGGVTRVRADQEVVGHGLRELRRSSINSSVRPSTVVFKKAPGKLRSLLFKNPDLLGHSAIRQAVLEVDGHRLAVD